MEKSVSTSVKDSPNTLNRHCIIVGVPKAASTSVFNYLRNHPEVSVPPKKEPNFFCRMENHSRDFSPEIIYNKYQNIFNNNEKVMVDASVSYSEKDNYLKQIRYILGDNVKIILLVRDPLSRLYSTYCMYKRNKKIDESIDFDQFITDIILKDDNTIFHQSRYNHILEVLEACFPSQNIYTLSMEDLKEDSYKEMIKIAGFIGIDQSYFSRITFHHHNVNQYDNSSTYKIYYKVKNFIRFHMPRFFVFCRKVGLDYILKFSPPIKRKERFEKNIVIGNKALGLLKASIQKDIALFKKKTGIGGNWVHF